jgi:hypothetical protein
MFSTQRVISTYEVYDYVMIWQHNMPILKGVRSHRIVPGDLVTHVWYEFSLGTVISVVADMVTVLWSKPPIDTYASTGGNLILRSGTGSTTTLIYNQNTPAPVIYQGNSGSVSSNLTIRAQSTTK